MFLLSCWRMNIVIEGLIGVGKSTVLEAVVLLLQRKYSINARGIKEPLDQDYAFLTQVLIMSTLGTEIVYKSYLNKDNIL